MKDLQKAVEEQIVAEKFDLVADEGTLLVTWWRPVDQYVDMQISGNLMTEGIFIVGTVAFRINEKVELFVEGQRLWRWRVGKKEPSYDPAD